MNKIILKIKYLTKLNNLCIISIGNGEATNVVHLIRVLTHLTRESLQMCLFFVYSLLLKIIASAIITAIAMIVIPISA